MFLVIQIKSKRWDPLAPIDMSYVFLELKIVVMWNGYADCTKPPTLED